MGQLLCANYQLHFQLLVGLLFLLLVHLPFPCGFLSRFSFSFPSVSSLFCLFHYLDLAVWSVCSSDRGSSSALKSYFLDLFVVVLLV